MSSTSCSPSSSDGVVVSLVAALRMTASNGEGVAVGIATSSGTTLALDSVAKALMAMQYPLNNWNLNKSTKGLGGNNGRVYPLYDLYAILHHVGNVGQGHYMLHARNRFDGPWYNFNNGRCNRIINNPMMRMEVQESGG
jgi:hypothetical protein